MPKPRGEWASMPVCRLLTAEEQRASEKARHAAVGKWQKENGYESGPWPAELVALNDSFRPPGTMWFCPWYFDPKDSEDLANLDAWIEEARRPEYNGHLSIHYLQDWARIRPPICVVCPDGRDWIVDAKSSNGTGWVVQGEAPKLVVSPSIWTSMSMGPESYHGFLGTNGAPAGQFTAPV